MKFHEFAEYLNRLENTSKRLEITSILTELLTTLSPEETDKAIYLASGYLKAPFENPKFNIAEKMMIRILDLAYAKDSLGIYKTEGDLGNVAYLIAPKESSTKLSVSEVHERMLKIALIEGSGSQEQKILKTTALLKDLDGLSAKYAVRIILGTTRLGFTELTIIAALAGFLGDKTKAEEIEKRFNIHPDIGLIARSLKEKGLVALNEIQIEPGVPVLSQKAQRVSGMEEAFERIPNIWAEFKFDGTRVQLHMDRNKIVKGNKTDQMSIFLSDENKFLLKTFTRNLEETTHQYPDITEAARDQIEAESIILDGEAIGFNKITGEFLPFQETIQRKRKHGVEEMAKNIPLKYFVFDILYLNGKSLIEKPLRERRKILDSVIKPGLTLVVDEHEEINNFEDLQEYFEIAKERKLEGLLVKNPEDPYQAGARSYSWIKLKKADEKLLSDSVDCVVLGYYVGKGVRSKFGIGGFLVGIYDEKTDTFKTISKIGTGLKEDDWNKLKALADKNKVKEKPANVEMDKMFTPDVYVAPKIVVEIGADEISVSQNHTANFALRFPRLLKFREDKSPLEATTLDEIKEMFKNQRK